MVLRSNEPPRTPFGVQSGADLERRRSRALRLTYIPANKKRQTRLRPAGEPV